MKVRKMNKAFITSFNTYLLINITYGIKSTMYMLLILKELLI